ncbi:hypothetical protein AAG570_004433 [Ranatra chinensis]|uniref:Uncharacterized protein n=1 Tax=Ranatra chinensis TaxID=642074 RepID=A0ABD0Y2B8_9HEMI
MLGADCAESYLKSIPTYLKEKNIEILDASINRIRVLTNSSLEGLYYLKYLYLADNSIGIIEAAAFEHTPSLEVLDLSLNSIREVPPLLPTTLRKLYLAENLLESVPLEVAGPSLQYVSLASSRLSRLPNLGVLPVLQELNLTDNPLERITVVELASFCHLETLLLPDHLLRPHFLASCHCLRLGNWTRYHNIYVSPIFNCTTPDDLDCETNSTTEVDVYAACQSSYQEQAVTHWALVGGAACAVVLCVLLLTALWRRRWTSRRKRQKRATTGQANSMAANNKMDDIDAPQNNRKLLKDSNTKPRF